MFFLLLESTTSIYANFLLQVQRRNTKPIDTHQPRIFSPIAFSRRLILKSTRSSMPSCYAIRYRIIINISIILPHLETIQETRFWVNKTQDPSAFFYQDNIKK